MWYIVIPLALAAYYLTPRPTIPRKILKPFNKRTNISANASNTTEPKLFPEDAPGDDRIINQLLFSLPKNKGLPIKKIFLPNGFDAWDVPSGRREFLRNKCSVNRCTLTADSSDSASADAVLFKNSNERFHLRPLSNQTWIWYNLESPYHTTRLRYSSVVFNWTATYRRDSDIVTPYARWIYYNPNITERELDRNYAANKTKKVAWFVSNCRTPNSRMQYALALSQFIPVDIYGGCSTHRCPRSDPGCSKTLNRDYKFYLSFENSNCRDYITEKFFVNGLGHDVLPVVMGARPEEYAAVAPHHSYVHIEDFEDAEELAAYLRRLDEDDELYNSYFKWKGTGKFINTYFFCRICAMLHANARRQRTAHYTDVQAWWHRSKDPCTRGEWRSHSTTPIL
ncbi:glycoprotein 3-alpha-L-fucosyltransferase A-like isoform X5 [Pectinophora gossypiella]|uniref:glycoprotein 3-alpha-L-fucosyltransferase A-like isoform X1 n=1 Tax=Pectinophora gossypiella TaxID=13191 RepID=UPI00214EA99C|nr:glycoprotein 3-alpha-L-fucosyltransferase A-like isoform X1 [Pectinophora gossypiella]XP_049886160.1 glycoprotein 3-alpha-L-fucosyltransferase A-like isoform X2 [Pectinophora gossypiella]XP_049886161.1 glycoprotein 3-alpha-L-fucosyltransferase A-like isoform X3 [Pectinophora gossypiella]XP_049886162.1 glycoprotein 3-alpha-L-fucosyltransferase A-like isoform X4 [Pectinophora gossypiella]XP_049886163.1 glycoprotein 3-alpha-L-fucosyltransferase A-like isoform X5 [Pectinophora gossypiella]